MCEFVWHSAHAYSTHVRLIRSISPRTANAMTAMTTSIVLWLFKSVSLPNGTLLAIRINIYISIYIHVHVRVYSSMLEHLAIVEHMVVPSRYCIQNELYACEHCPC